MKLRDFCLAGVLVLAACPGPTAKPTPTVSSQKELPTAVELADLKQLDPKDGTALVVLTLDLEKAIYVTYQMDTATCTAQRAYKVGDAQIPTLEKAGQFIVIRPNPPPPPDGEDLRRYLTEQCQAGLPK